MLGTLVLWVGWMLFNGGSSHGITIKDVNDPGNDGWDSAARAMVNTVLSPCVSGLLTFIIRKRITG